MDMTSFNLVKHDPKIVRRIQLLNSKTLAKWAIQCIERFLPIFKEKYPENNVPNRAIKTLIAWMNNDMKMWDARKYCFVILKAARDFEKTDKVATLFLRGTSHMLATCHVKTHSEGAAMYVIAALKELHKNDHNQITLLEQERVWQIKQLDLLADYIK